MHPPQKVVSELKRRRGFERGDAAALRVHARKDAANRPVLAGGVEALEDEQEAPSSLGVEPHLDVGELVEQRVELRR